MSLKVTSKIFRTFGTRRKPKRRQGSMPPSSRTRGLTASRR
jgi:hypothetical protein